MDKRKLAALFGLSAVVFVLVWQHVEATRLGYQVQKVRKKITWQAGQNAYYTQQIQNFKSPDRLMARASRELNMVIPPPEAIVSLYDSKPELLVARESGRRNIAARMNALRVEGLRRFARVLPSPPLLPPK
ncbi:MAG: hypothetical protein HY611_02235 [Elusimicrobia bacterium]|nr:hypothetical protein [Elusimicrobiota bacterium]